MRQAARKAMKPFLVAVGAISTGLAVLGAVLPGLPTTPFLLVALWAFARSSERLHNWLMRVPLLKTALVEAERFEEKRAIRPAVKIFALATAWASFAVTVYLSAGVTSMPAVIVGLAAVAASVFVVLIPNDRS